MKNLRLERPLVCFDLETTGIDFVRDRIVQVGLVRVEPDGSRSTFEALVDPEMPIPAGATAIHGITDADVAGQPTFRRLLPRLVPLFTDCDLAGYNMIRFDLPLIQAEIERAGGGLDLTDRRLLDAMVIFHQKEKRDLTSALRFYCDQELVDAHTALADATATVEILDGQLARYDDLPRDAVGLHGFCNPDEGRWVDATRKFAWNDEGRVAFAFGKHRGHSLEEIAGTKPDYLDWMAGSDFPPEVKRIVQEAKAGRFPRRKK